MVSMATTTALTTTTTSAFSPIPAQRTACSGHNMGRPDLHHQGSSSSIHWIQVQQETHRSGTNLFRTHSNPLRLHILEMDKDALSSTESHTASHHSPGFAHHTHQSHIQSTSLSLLINSAQIQTAYPK
jgi:hypothetical protein